MPLLVPLDLQVVESRHELVDVQSRAEPTARLAGNGAELHPPITPLDPVKNTPQDLQRAPCTLAGTLGKRGPQIFPIIGMETIEPSPLTRLV
ncbi:hypothetical protein GCM10010862_25950 [Devosia nitrariae]|uniref:Uncharacterized protein n=1 Tax=Devosia nitrariae TaxID=2071872 RepID=A0ABQ5W6S2_9HYPH|nr:hypothetical protein GCM10010862_25950 [Devosia nitrariae]